MKQLGRVLKKAIVTILFPGMILLFLSSLIFNPAQQYQDDWIAPSFADKLKNPITDNENARIAGEELYNLHCWTCHGETGNGDGPAAGPLVIKPADVSDSRVLNQSDGAIFWKLSNGRSTMLPYKDMLSEIERWQLVVYIRYLGENF